MQSKGWLTVLDMMKSLARYKKIFFAWCLGAYRVTDKLEQKEKKQKRRWSYKSPRNRTRILYRFNIQKNYLRCTVPCTCLFFFVLNITFSESHYSFYYCSSGKWTSVISVYFFVKYIQYFVIFGGKHII